MNPAELLTHWVEGKHRGQLVKKTADPYFTHLLAVANMAAPLMAFGFEIGICHDLLEDTGTTAEELTAALARFGYNAKDADYITFTVVELTDVYTSAAFPGLTKEERKEREAQRLYKTSPAAQTLKCCDLADNIKWVLQHDRKHARRYLAKKERLVTALTAGEPEMRRKMLDIIHFSLTTLKN